MSGRHVRASLSRVRSSCGNGRPSILLSSHLGPGEYVSPRDAPCAGHWYLLPVVIMIRLTPHFISLSSSSMAPLSASALSCLSNPNRITITVPSYADAYGARRSVLHTAICQPNSNQLGRFGTTWTTPSLCCCCEKWTYTTSEPLYHVFDTFDIESARGRPVLSTSNRAGPESQTSESRSQATFPSHRLEPRTSRALVPIFCSIHCPSPSPAGKRKKAGHWH